VFSCLPMLLAILIVLDLLFELEITERVATFFATPFIWLRKASLPQTKPVIAYKKALLDPNGELKGVTGTPYKADDKAVNDMGFHAYSSFQRARKHTQEGDVMLEVLLSGKIEKMDLGYIAENQRVLQVILHRCSFWGCPGVPRAFSIKSFEWEEEEERPLFLCRSHAKVERFESRIVRIMSSLARLVGKEPAKFEVFPISALPEKLPWISEQKIAVATLSGKHKFVPTVIPD